jgi:hypothetical protein
MQARLTAYLPARAAEPKIFPSGSYLVGRSADADLNLPDLRVSREHLRLVGGEDGWRIEDLASKNGTRLDGRPVSRATLDRAAWLSVGGVPVRFEEIGADKLGETQRRESGLRRKAEDIASRLRSQNALEGLLDACLDGALELSGCKRASIWTRNANDGLALLRRRGAETPRESSEAMRRAFDEGETVLANDVTAIEALATRQSVAGGGIRALFCLPLKARGSTLGILYTDSHEVGKAFSALDAELLQSLAEQAALSLSAAALAGEIRRLAPTAEGPG